ncbi:hypothetical protein B0T19DRAFT_446624 [Cercophora scortea]|uniref:CFEM domain-containing protein n=1 Tax=Cercophora scortea TaxID=314031 RepID=A0AAE0M368_9PEZI|nr:hypothetical protein B0T19DRAFT_446624 [Cercophora scortea]
MKLLTILSFGISLAVAQDPTPTTTIMPTCATGCLAAAATSIGCATTDIACQCVSSSALQAQAAPCVVASCGVFSVQSVLSAGSAICSAYTTV